MSIPEPYYLLKKFISELPKGNVLDIGSGAGKNSIYLAKEGFSITAIDSNKKALDILDDIIKEEKLNIVTQQIDLRNFKFKTYSVVLALNALPFLKYSERNDIIQKIKDSVNPNGIIFISAFTIKDDSYKKLSAKKEAIEKNTFYSENQDMYWNFFELGELKSYFEDNFEILFYDEKEIEDAHPEPHFHGIAEIVARKKER